MLNSESSIFSKSKKEIYEDYVKKFQLEKLISEMTNSLVHSQASNPIIYMIKYLTGLLSEEEKVKNNINIPPPYPQGIPIVRFPKFKSKNILSKYLTRDNWSYIKRKKTLYNNNINDITKLSNNSNLDPIGCCIVDDDVLNTFQNLFDDIISDIHSISKNNFNKINFDINSLDEISEKDIYILNEINNNITDILIEFNRNVEGFTMNNINKKNNLLKDEICQELIRMKNEGFFDESFKEINNYDTLFESEPQLKEEIEWMKNSGIKNESYNNLDSMFYSNKDNSIMILINFSNHFKLWVKGKKKNNENINFINLFNQAIRIMKRISLSFEFITCKYGYVTSNISLLGCGFRIYTTFNSINLSNFKEEINNLNFSKVIILNNSILTYQDCHLNEESIIEFLIKFFGKFSSLLKLSKENKKIKLKKIELKETNLIQSSYFSTFDKLKYTISPYGRNINDIIEYYSKDEKNNFIILFDKNEYYSFYPFISKYILFSQYFNLDENYHISKPETLQKFTELSISNLERVKNLKINVYRNIKNYPFSCNPYYKNNLENVENEIKKVINQINLKHHIATYFSLEDKSINDLIKQNNIPILHKDTMKFDINYPKNRAIIKFEQKNLFGIVNDLDHFKLYFYLETIENMDQITNNIIQILELLNEFEREINFEFNKKFGYINSNPSFIGNGMKIQIDLKLNNLKNEEIDDWSEGKGIIWDKINDNYYRLENQICIGISEIEMFCNFIFYIKQLIDLEENKTI